MTHHAIRSLESILAELDLRDLTSEATAIARAHNVLVTEMLGPRRTKSFTAARHAWWLFLRTLGWSYPNIAELTGHDHTSVLTAVKGKAGRAA